MILSKTNVIENVEMLKNLLKKKDIKKCKEFLLNVESSFLSYKDKNTESWNFVKMILAINEKNQQLAKGYGCFTFIYRENIDTTIEGYKDASDIFEEIEEQNQLVFDIFIPKKELTEFRINQMLMYSNMVGMDCYICTAELFKNSRRSESLKSTNVIVLDLDIYQTSYGIYSEYPDILDKELLKELQPVFQKIGYYPNFYLNSGRGRYLVFQLQNSINLQNDKMLKLLSGIKKRLVSEFQNFGADAKCIDAGRLIHMPGSINSKTKMNFDATYSKTNLYYPVYLNEYSKNAEFMYIKCSNVGYLENYHLTNISNLASSLGIQKKKTSKNNFVLDTKKFSSKYSKVNVQRIEDFHKLIQLRNYDLMGNRNYFFEFLTNTLFYTGYSEEDIWNYIKSENNSLKIPLKETQLQSIFHYNVNNLKKYKEDSSKGVKYTNRHIVELLNISSDEQIEMKQLIGNKEAEKREHIRLQKLQEKRKEARKNKKSSVKENLKQVEENNKSSKKETASQELKQNIQMMVDMGMSIKEIANILKISEKTVKNYKR